MSSRIASAPRAARYSVLPHAPASFAIDEFGLAKPFASFLPGIAGPLGVPLWCFYVNRGQGVCAFGVQDKDGALLEFEPANKAYRQVCQTGFRSFLRLGPEGRFYEPFQENQANQGFERRTRMVLTPHELRLEEVNHDLGLKFKVHYFGLPQRPLAALCRELSIESLNGEALDLEILDGLPVLAPFGLGDLPRKTMGRTMEAWSHAEGLDEGLPYLRQRSSSDDGVEVRAVSEGHFFAGWAPGHGPGAPVVDPAAVFGPAGDLAFPAHFAAQGWAAGPQQVENRSPCGLLHWRLRLEPGQALRLRSLYGRAQGLAEARSLATELRQPGAFEAWAAENERCVMQAAAPGWIASGSPPLDGYALQSFLDNVLRGGLATPLQDGPRRSVLHLYSRKHGDLERDYNAFQLSPSPYSQGNGAFRDICQNRRNDAWTHPDAGDLSLRSFCQLLQLDGNNPLLVQGLEYAWDGGEEGQARLQALLGPEGARALLLRLQRPVSPQELHALDPALVAAVLTRSQPIVRAEPGHGYWTDHGFYLTDMLESFEGLYPDRLPALLADPGFSYYDNPLRVVPRAEKLRATARGWRQYGAVHWDEEKAALIQSRGDEPQRARSGLGQGPVFHCSLWAKLICFAANKLASLDAQGRGLEMDSEKPDWNDAVNGLPGLFGSSSNGSMELLRLLRLMRRWLGEAPSRVELHLELDALLKGLLAAPAEPFAYWVEAGRLKERYRDATRLGVQGTRQAWGPEALLAFFEAGIKRLEDGLAAARRPDGLIHTYFVNSPTVSDSIDGFHSEPMPLFLEGQVHYLRLCGQSEAQHVAQTVERSPLYDRGLGMFKVNAPLDGAPLELGRLQAFTPGWLENGSVFMHMEFKYLLELARQGLWDDFYRHFFAACPAFQDPARYGRSVFESSSFIASSSNPDPSVRGQGFVARLSGTTSEVYDLLLTLALGRPAFRMEGGRLRFEPRPALHRSLFSREISERCVPGGAPFVLNANAFALRCFGGTLVVIQGAAERDCFGPDALVVKSLRLHQNGKHCLQGPCLEQTEALALRSGEFDRLDILLG